MAEELTEIGLLRPLLGRSPLAFISDIDGTLAPIVARPEEAVISPRCRLLLKELLERGVRIALITGRPLDVARAMVALEGITYAANHGLSLWLEGEETPVMLDEYVGRVQQVMREIAGGGIPGVTLENKGPVLALHYRGAVNEEAARKAILRAVQASPAARAFRLHEGRKVMELRPPVDIDKGTALAALVPRLSAAAVICLGDDTTDIDMFRAVGRLREAGLPGVTVAVRSEEATPEVLASADYWVDGVPGVERLLAELLTALPATQP